MRWFFAIEHCRPIEQAKQARMQSDAHKSEVTMGIMDVTEAAVLNAFTEHSVTQMIHGHTHRQNTHHYKIDSGNAVRYVLGDGTQAIAS